ncbi:phospholipase A2 [Sulfurimonas sp.]|nr:phospholipase A2 [Sulfurimonas sp.]
MTQNNKTYYLHYDQVGTLKLISDKNHNIIKEVTYDTFGNILNDTNKNFKIPFGFAGGLQDKDTNLVHFGYREYDPQTGKWTAKDPIDFQGGDANLYGYVLNNPVNFVDPTGLACGSGCIGDLLVPDTSFNFNFTQSCVNHDNCYSNNGMSKDECDSSFLDDMKQSCLNEPFLLQSGCFKHAYDYYDAVKVLGESAYQNAQNSN